MKGKHCATEEKIRIPREAVPERAIGGAPNCSLSLQPPCGARLEMGNAAQAALAAELLRAVGKSC